MTDQTYNGWKNYPTWCTHLWITNERESYNYCRELTEQGMSDKAVSGDLRYLTVADLLKEFVEETMPTSGLCADLLNYAMGCVDWNEIADSFIAEIDS